MSRIVCRMPDRQLCHVVLTDDNKYYYVDSCYTLDAGFETMVFECDKSRRVLNYIDIYSEHHADVATMESDHDYIIHDLEEVLKK